jgi:hypothetical protein
MKSPELLFFLCFLLLLLFLYLFIYFNFSVFFFLKERPRSLSPFKKNLSLSLSLDLISPSPSHSSSSLSGQRLRQAMGSGHGVGDVVDVGSKAEGRISGRIRPKPTPCRISSRIQREIRPEYVDFRPVLSFSPPFQPPYHHSLPNHQADLFFFFFW